MSVRTRFLSILLRQALTLIYKPLPARASHLHERGGVLSCNLPGDPGRAGESFSWWLRLPRLVYPLVASVVDLIAVAIRCCLLVGIVTCTPVTLVPIAFTHC